MRFSAYAFVSTAVLAGITYRAYEQRQQFYPTVRRRRARVALA